MRIALINPLIRPEEKPMYFPLGLGYIASSLVRDGHEVSVIDLSGVPLEEGEIRQRLREIRPELVGITGLLTEYRQIINLSQMVRAAEPQAKLILGGGLASLEPLLMLEKTGAEAVVIGEGEATVSRLVASLEGGGRLDQVAGIACRQDGRPVRHPPAPLIQELDQVPLPAWELFPAEVYFHNLRRCWLFDRPGKAASILISRGCPFSCTYCDHSIWGRRHRRRSVAGVIEELRELKRRYEIESFLVADDTFTLKREWCLEFCRELLASGLKLGWVCNSRVDLVDQELLRAFKQAGCATVAYGIESASASILQELGKQTTVEQIRQALRLTQEAGIALRVYLMMGSFSETRETVFQTVELLREFNLPGSFNIVTPVPGTAVFEEARRRGRIAAPIEELLEGWAKWQETVLVALSEHLPPGELLKLQQEAELAISRNLRRPSLPVRVYRYWRDRGLSATARRIAEKVAGR